MNTYYYMSTHIIIQSHKFYDRIITRIFVSIPKYKYSYNCKYLCKYLYFILRYTYIYSRRYINFI